MKRAAILAIVWGIWVWAIWGVVPANASDHCDQGLDPTEVCEHGPGFEAVQSCDPAGIRWWGSLPAGETGTILLDGIPVGHLHGAGLYDADGQTGLLPYNPTEWTPIDVVWSGGIIQTMLAEADYGDDDLPPGPEPATAGTASSTLASTRARPTPPTMTVTTVSPLAAWLLQINA